jgi:hypothetical protein
MPPRPLQRCICADAESVMSAKLPMVATAVSATANLFMMVLLLHNSDGTLAVNAVTSEGLRPPGDT